MKIILFTQFHRHILKNFVYFMICQPIEYQSLLIKILETYWVYHISGADTDHYRFMAKLPDVHEFQGDCAKIGDVRRLWHPYNISSIITHKFPATIIEVFHRLIGRVKDYPVMPYGLFTLFADPYNLGVSEVFKVVMIFSVQFMFSHFSALPLL